MKHDKPQDRPPRRKRTNRDEPELRVVEINVNPAPDAQERLRRLFTILSRLAVDGDDETGTGQDSHAVRMPGEDDDVQGR